MASRPRWRPTTGPLIAAIEHSVKWRSKPSGATIDASWDDIRIAWATTIFRLPFWVNALTLFPLSPARIQNLPRVILGLPISSCNGDSQTVPAGMPFCSRHLRNPVMSPAPPTALFQIPQCSRRSTGTRGYSSQIPTSPNTSGSQHRLNISGRTPTPAPPTQTPHRIPPTSRRHPIQR